MRVVWTSSGTLVRCETCNWRHEFGRDNTHELIRLFRVANDHLIEKHGETLHLTFGPTKEVP